MCDICDMNTTTGSRAQDLAGLVEESSEAAKEEVEALRNRLEAIAEQSDSLTQTAEILSRQVAAAETLAEATKAASEQLAEQLDAGLQQEAEERDSKFLEVSLSIQAGSHLTHGGSSF